MKEFLWKKNNAKDLNIDKLVVIGVDEGAALALCYAAFDAVGYDKGMGPGSAVRLNWASSSRLRC